MFKEQNLFGHFNITCTLFCFPASYIPPQQPIPWRSYVGAAILGGGIGYTLAHLFKVKKVQHYCKIHCTTIYMLNLPYLKMSRCFQHKFAVLCTSTSHPCHKMRQPFLCVFQSHVKVETFAGQRLSCTCSYFFSHFYRPWVLIQPLGIELRLSCS